MYFWIDELLETWLDKCLKSPVWKDPSTNNKVNVPKHCSKMDDNAFNMLIDPCGSN